MEPESSLSTPAISAKDMDFYEKVNENTWKIVTLLDLDLEFEKKQM
jgi:hypothetical protein